MKVGDQVCLKTASVAHPWTERLVGDEGTALEVGEKAVAVGGMLEGVLWFSPKQLEVIPNKEDAA